MAEFQLVKVKISFKSAAEFLQLSLRRINAGKPCIIIMQLVAKNLQPVWTPIFGRTRSSADVEAFFDLKCVDLVCPTETVHSAV